MTEFEKIVKEGSKNIILSLNSNAEELFCYLLKEGYHADRVILVISPYVERIKDEIKYLKTLNISATTITNETSIKDREEIYKTFSDNIFYVTPEMIAIGYVDARNFVNDLLTNKVDTVVFEEADLITYTFRQSFQVLKKIRDKFPDIQWIALTTDASDSKIQEIASSLSMGTYTKISME